MKQVPIDLLPVSIRQRSQARQRTAQLVAATVTAILVIGVLAAHARVGAQRSRLRLEEAEARAADVLELEVRAEALRLVLADLDEYIDRYDEVALPLPITSVLATLINKLPDSVTLTRISMDAAHRRPARSPRSRSLDTPAATPPRVLIAEIGGFAANDADIAELVERLSQAPPMEQVTLDFSRTRPVRERLAREFRMSFRVDVEADFIVSWDDVRAETTPPTRPASAGVLTRVEP